MDISARIKLIRGDVRQEDFADKLGVKKNTVGRWERGEQTPSYEALSNILMHFPNINHTWLLTGEGEMWRFDNNSDDHVDLINYLREISVTTLSGVCQAYGFDYQKIRKYVYGNYSPTHDETKIIFKIANSIKYKDNHESVNIIKDIKNEIHTSNWINYNKDLLIQAVETVEIALIDTGRTMPPRKKGEMVAAVYDFFSEREVTEEAKSNVLRLIKSAV